MEDQKNNYDDRINAIRQLLELFKFERMVYLGGTVFSVIVLLGCAIYLLRQGESQIPAVVGMFTSTGGVAVTCGRLLKMWSDAMQLLSSIQNNN